MLKHTHKDQVSPQAEKEALIDQILENSKEKMRIDSMPGGKWDLTQNEYTGASGGVFDFNSGKLNRD